MISVEEYKQRHLTVVAGGDNVEVVTGPRGERGEKGDKGDPGVSDVPGPQGERGEQGIQGEPGPAGKDGKDGINGKDGLPGAVGPAGAQGPAGVGIKGFASGYVNAGTFVTLDNLKFTVTTGGQRGLSCATVSGTVNLSISATFGYVNGVGGSATTQSYTYNTTPSSSWFGWSFPNAGDGSVYLVNDTTNWRFYRVTLMIGPGYNNNFISIERLI
jgi:hypothetical protein